MMQRLRLISGLVLFTFIATHLLNHALGLISLAAMEAGRVAFLAAWRNTPMTLLLYGALALHLVLVLWSVFQRRRLDLSGWEWVQLLLGLSLPPLAVLHVLGTRFAFERLGADDSYARLLLIYWTGSPVLLLRQIAVVLVSWIHGCIGLHFWLRLKPWYRGWLPLTYGLAIVIPLVSLLGFAVAGQEVRALAADPDWVEALRQRDGFPDAAGLAKMARAEAGILGVFFALLVLTFLARWVRALLERRHGRIFVTYPSGRKVPANKGATLLEISRGAGIPHASVCGGRGRCSTCRARIGAGFEQLTAPNETEERVLARISAPPRVRLACQTRPIADVEMVPLLAPGSDLRPSGSGPGYLQGEEREIAILFADLRGFTTLSENKLPYDVVFLLNQYFRAMGEAIEEVGGRLDKFIGDGVMALFGIRHGPHEGSRRALAAARRMSERLAEINAVLRGDLPEPLRIGIGVHTGAVIVGEMGYGPAVSLTAVGDAVNAASRLESMTKELGVQLVVSEPVALAAGLDLSAFAHHEIELRGRSGRLPVIAIADARRLPAVKAAE